MKRVVIAMLLVLAGAAAGYPQNSKFELFMRSNGVSSKDRAPFSQNAYSTPSGEKVYELIIHLDSAEGAKKEVEYWVGRASKVVDRQQIKTKTGTEERVVITIEGKKCKEATFIMETDGTILHQIQACSAQIALDFEKEFKNNSIQTKSE